MSRCTVFGAAIIPLLTLCTPPATAQFYNPYTINPYTCDVTRYDCQLARQELDERKAAEAAARARHLAEMNALRREMLRQPVLPPERNPLLGSWRLEGSGPGTGLAGTTERALSYKGGGGAGAGLGEMFGALANMNTDKVVCETAFGRGIRFSATSYGGDGAAGAMGGTIEYRSRDKQVVVAIPVDTRAQWMAFAFTGPNRIVWNDSCVLVRTQSPADHGTAGREGTQAAVPPAPAMAPQVAALSPAMPTPSAARPSPEVCRNTLLDQLGKVGVNQVRVMSDFRYKELAIEGKDPNTGNLRIDLRGSACDDPRIKATLYDFDANQMLQSITYVWDRPPGPAPAPIFQERVAALSRLHSLPPPHSPSRLQADTSLGHLILEDRPDRNLLLEAYKAKK